MHYYLQHIRYINTVSHNLLMLCTSYRIYMNTDHSKLLWPLYSMPIKGNIWAHWNSSVFSYANFRINSYLSNTLKISSLYLILFMTFKWITPLHDVILSSYSPILSASVLCWLPNLYLTSPCYGVCKQPSYYTFITTNQYL